MVGLSIVLEAQKGGASGSNKKSPQVINKVTMTKTTQHSPLYSTSSSHSSATCSTLGTSFLDECFLCRKKLLPAEDIYMYKGDKGFCSVECRCRQIYMDEKDQTAAKKNTYNNVKKTTNCSSYYSSSSSSSSTSKTTRDRASEFAG